MRVPRKTPSHSAESAARNRLEDDCSCSVDELARKSTSNRGSIVYVEYAAHPDSSQQSVHDFERARNSSSDRTSKELIRNMDDIVHFSLAVQPSSASKSSDRWLASSNPMRFLLPPSCIQIPRFQFAMSRWRLTLSRRWTRYTVSWLTRATKR